MYLLLAGRSRRSTEGVGLELEGGLRRRGLVVLHCRLLVSYTGPDFRNAGRRLVDNGRCLPAVREATRGSEFERVGVCSGGEHESFRAA